MTSHAYLGQCCEHCGRVFYDAATAGRPRRYCSNACKQRAYRRAKDDARGRKLTEDARRFLEECDFRNVEECDFRNAASRPGGDHRVRVTKPIHQEGGAS